MIKPGYEQPIDEKTYAYTLTFFENLLKVLQPFTPFVAEELWHLIRERAEGNDLIIETWPIVGAIDKKMLQSFEQTSEVITQIRNVRKQGNIANKVKLDLFIKENELADKAFDSVISKLGNLTTLEYVREKKENAFSFLFKSNEYFIPFGDSVDVVAEKAKIEEELKYTKGFLISVQKKLQNQKFVASAPDQVVAFERQKEADALNKINVLEEKLVGLN
jgi:valyl-tRNA synthetase